MEFSEYLQWDRQIDIAPPCIFSLHPFRRYGAGAMQWLDARGCKPKLTRGSPLFLSDPHLFCMHQCSIGQSLTLLFRIFICFWIIDTVLNVFFCIKWCKFWIFRPRSFQGALRLRWEKKETVKIIMVYTLELATITICLSETDIYNYSNVGCKVNSVFNYYSLVLCILSPSMYLHYFESFV